MAQDTGFGAGDGGGGFLQVLGIIYLVKRIRQRRAERREAQARDAGAANAE